MGKIANSELASPIYSRESTERRTDSVCRLCDLSDWQNPEFSKRASEVRAAEDRSAPIHRKLWEFTSAVLALERLGLLDGESAGLAVASGTERILFYLANRVERLVATDIYGIGDFADREADARFLDDPESFATHPYDPKRLSVCSMDALNLEFPDSIFDFAFSFSSLEHFGGLRNAEHSLAEMGRVVRPGGAVIVTTECSLNGKRTDEVFLPRELAAFGKKSNLELADEIDFSLSKETLEHLTSMSFDDINHLPHLNLMLLHSVFTSICLVFRKPSGPVGEFPARLESIDSSVAQARSRELQLATPTLTSRTSQFLKKKIQRVSYEVHKSTGYLRRFGY